MKETRVQPLGWEDLEKKMTTCCSVLPWETQRSLAGYTHEAAKELDAT